MKLEDLIASSAAVMAARLEEIRRASPHAGLKGGAAEEVLAQFLSERLPASLGVTAGHVVDRDGSISKQVDVIVYHAGRTPLMFTSPGSTWNVVPAEGVLAVIEVKMHLQAADIPGVLANCATVLNLRRDAYIGPEQARFNAHGRAYSELPICYYLFAFETDAMYADKLNEQQQGLHLSERVTAVCYLDRGLSMHFQFDGMKPIYSELPAAPGVMVDVDTEASLLAWFACLSTVLFQADLRPISLIDYAGDALSAMPGSLGPQPEADRLRLLEAVSDQFLGQLGLPPGLGVKVFTQEPLDEVELEALRAAGATFTQDKDGRLNIRLPEPPSQH